jgi:8-amino-7-oxononanoate synthase
MFRPKFNDRLEKLQEQGLYRRLQVNEGPQGVVVRVNGQSLLSFCSNDYLGLANHPAVVEGLKRGVEQYGVGSGSAHLISGHREVHHALEEELADYLGFERVLLFSTGYMANIGVISALIGRGDRVFEDRLNHASLLDGGLLSGARFSRYPHADLDALSASVQEGGESTGLVVSDGVFSMDGDLAPLPALSRLCKSSDNGLFVDDAHGLGVLGRYGRGSLEHHGLSPDDVTVLVGTLGKAFGTFGAFAAGSNSLIDYLVQKARTYIYTTAMPPGIAEATRASLQIVRSESWRRQKLEALIQQFRKGALELGLPVIDSLTPIQPLVVGDSRQAMTMATRLRESGILVIPIRPPTVAEGGARLRITFSAQHEAVQVERLLEGLVSAIGETRG